MALHPRLEACRSVKNVRRFGKLLRFVEQELAAAGVREHEVEIWEADRPKSALKRFLTVEAGNEPHQALVVAGEGHARPFHVTVPLRHSRTMPYTFEALLQVPVSFAASYRSGLLGARWKLEDGPPQLEGWVRGLPAPKVKWAHAAGGYNYTVHVGSSLQPATDDPSQTIWSVTSGYQGFITKVGPRVRQYLDDIPTMERALASGPAPAT